MNPYEDEDRERYGDLLVFHGERMRPHGLVTVASPVSGSTSFHVSFGTGRFEKRPEPVTTKWSSSLPIGPNHSSWKISELSYHD